MGILAEISHDLVCLSQVRHNSKELVGEPCIIPYLRADRVKQQMPAIIIYCSFLTRYIVYFIHLFNIYWFLDTDDIVQ